MIKRRYNILRWKCYFCIKKTETFFSSKNQASKKNLCTVKKSRKFLSPTIVKKTIHHESIISIFSLYYIKTFSLCSTSMFLKKRLWKEEMKSLKNTRDCGNVRHDGMFSIYMWTLCRDRTGLGAFARGVTRRKHNRTCKKTLFFLFI